MRKLVDTMRRQQVNRVATGRWRRPLRRLFFLYLLCPASALADVPVEVSFAASTPHDGKPVSLRAELFRPEGEGRFPAVVLMHGCGGLQESVRHALRKHAQYFLRHGFVVLSLDSFGPRGNGDGWVCETFDRLMAARRYRTADALDALKYLQSLDFVDGDNVFQMGQSNGGSVAIRLAQLDKPAFRASAAYYPWCGTFNRLGSKAVLTSPLIVLTGALDDWTPPADCMSLQSTAAEYRVIVYPGAVHSFDLEISRQRYQGHQVGFDAGAASDSRKQMLAFFASHASDELRQSLRHLAQAERPAVAYLNEREIRELMPSGRLEGVNAYGNPYRISYSTDGAMSGVAGHRDQYKDTGQWWISDGLFCRQYKSWLDARAACFRVSLDGENISFFDADGNLASSGTFTSE